jgi:hypothetical protein
MADMHLLGNVGGGEVNYDPFPGTHVRRTHSLHNTWRIVQEEKEETERTLIDMLNNCTKQKLSIKKLEILWDFNNLLRIRI